MAKKKKDNSFITPVLLGLGALLIFNKKKKADTVAGIGKMKKKLHLLQAINNDFIRIKKQKWTHREIQDYIMDVLMKYSTPIFFFNESTLKGSTFESGDIKDESIQVVDFLEYNKKFIKENAEIKQDLYSQMLEVYAYKLRDIVDELN